MKRSTNAGQEDELRDAERREQELAERDSLRDECMRRLREGIGAQHLHLLTSVDLEAYESMVFADRSLEIAGKTTHEAKVQALRENLDSGGFIDQILSDAGQKERELAAVLKDAVDAQAISEERGTVERMTGKISAMLYYRKKLYITGELRTELRERKDAAQARQKLLKNPVQATLTEDDVPDIAVFRGKEFLDLSFPERRHLQGLVASAVDARRTGMEGVRTRVGGELRALASGPERCLHATKVGLWLQRVFSNCDTPAEVDEFMAKVVVPYARNWAEARSHFDGLEARTAEEGIPAGFRPLDLDAFLLLDYDQRVTHLEHWRSRLEAGGNSPAGRLGFLKGRVRHAFDMRDLDSALHHLKEAAALEPKDPELAEMRRYLRARGRDVAGEAPNPDPAEVLKEMRSIVGTLSHSDLRADYIDALGRGSGMAGALFRLSEMREWTHEVERTSSPEREREHQALLEAKAEARKGGDAEGKRETLDEPVEAVEVAESRVKMVYVERDDRPAFFQTLEHHAEDEAFQRERSYIPVGVPYTAQKNAIVHHARLLWGLRVLEENGMRFSLTDDQKAVQMAA